MEGTDLTFKAWCSQAADCTGGSEKSPSWRCRGLERQVEKGREIKRVSCHRNQGSLVLVSTAAKKKKKGQVRSGQNYDCWISGDFSTWEITGDFGNFSGDFSGMRDGKE